MVFYYPHCEEKGALSCIPVPARVAETGPQKSMSYAPPCDQTLPRSSTGEIPNRYDVCEVFSPPRICTTSIEHGLRRGWPIDMAFRDPTSGRKYDLRNSKDQSEVKRRIRRDCPTVLIVSPPCTAFSIANQGEIDKSILEGAIEMIRFSTDICELQHKSGR